MLIGNKLRMFALRALYYGANFRESNPCAI